MENQGSALIQVVEDDPHLNMAISETLRSYDFAVESFANGVQALDWLKHSRPDMILCDIMMPGMDGYTLLRHTRADPKLRMLPFIFLTARTSMADQRLAREIGIEDYLTKPIDSDNLVIAIKNALRRQQAMQEEMQLQMDALRNRIVSVLQHEFRTPLTFVLGYAEYLLESVETGVDMEELRSSTAAILDGGRRLQRLIEGFLLLAELQNQKLKPEDLRNLNARELWQSVVNWFEQPLQEAGLEVTILDHNSDAVVNGNADLLQEALKRMFDNAIRYRRSDSRQIVLTVEAVSAYIGLRIADDGVGMTPEQVRELAKPFEQADRESRTTSGAGLSLALIRHIAALHGGKLEITSEPGFGTTVTLWLTAAPSSPAEGQEA
jgi:two-component system sensor histidine kinase/response regulator